MLKAGDTVKVASPPTAAKSNLGEVGIVDHIAEKNPTRALSFVLKLRENYVGLAELLFGYTVAGRLAASDIRRCIHCNYLIFYRVRGIWIEVLHILGVAMDYECLVYPKSNDICVSLWLRLERAKSLEQALLRFCAHGGLI